MSRRDEIQKTMEESLALWGARLETIKTKRHSARPTPRDLEERKSFAEWEARSQDASAKVEALKRTQGDEWDERKLELMPILEELGQFVDGAEQALRDHDDQQKAARSSQSATSAPPAAAAPAVSSKPA